MSSVCLSVCLWRWWSHRLASEIISPSADPNIRGLLQGEHPEILAQLTHPRRHSIANCGWMVTDSASAQRSQWTAYRKPPSLFRTVPSLTSYDLPFLQNWGSTCPKVREWPYLRNGWSDTLHVWFSGRVFRIGGSNGAISGYIKSKLAEGRHLG